jgi:hypothetical protein
VVFIFSDGSFSEIGPGLKDPGDMTAELAAKYNVCFHVSLSNTFIAKFLTLKDTEDFQSPPASLTQTAFQNEPFLLANQFR